MKSKRNLLTGFRQLPLFSLFGFEVKLDPSWFLLGLLITWTLAAGVFPVEYPELESRYYWWMGIASAIGIFFSIVFHEFSHSMVARQFGLQIKSITLFIFGGMAEMEKEPPSPKSEFMMAVAGPLASFLLAFVFSRIEALALASNWPVQIIGVTHYLAFVNLIVAVFNLVPAFPLDGGRMLRALLWRTKRSLHDATYIATRIGEGFGIFLMIFGVLAFIQGNFIGGMWWFLIGMFVRGAASASYQQLLLQEVVHDQPVSAFMRVNPIAVPPSITIDKWVEDYVYRHHFKMFPVVKDSELLGCIRVESLGKLSKNDWPDTLVRDLMETSSEANTIAPDTSTMKLLTDMVNGRKHSRYMVVDRGQLVGMISLKDLLELIALKLEIEAPKGAPSD